ncbi:hypothetical protein HPP92_004651 [Vanilla planifolia]|uniref:Protein FAR1-RELATED SEQUENCE n=1 Tax=Vanilla planifolia TaxID=51239 RepID=A0A835RS93_VANPL|nr:hypothetical protein HPP92_004651 [Vanilla planifolia]
MDDRAAAAKNPRRARLTGRDFNSQEILGLANMEESGDLDELEEDEIEVGSDNDSGCYGAPEVGMVFTTHQEVSKFYKKYARRVGFGVSVRRSSFTKEGHCLYLELMCCKGGRKRPEPKFRKRATATTNCPARIRVKLWGDGLLHLELASLDHNHQVSQAMARRMFSYKNLSGSGKKRAMIHEEGSANQVEGASLPGTPPNRFGFLNESLFRERGCRSFVERGRLKLVEGDAEALRLFFTRMQAKNPNFFTVIDLNDEGCVRNVFWADARSRAAYQYYNDVVVLDTSCVINKYALSLATFVGVNHHGQPVLLGSAFLSDETSETYVWLLKAWIACMTGLLPKAFITDQCKSIQDSVSEVLPGVRHSFCLWQIMKKATEKLGGLPEYRAIHKTMQKAIYDSLRVDDFEEEWRKMIEVYGLQGNEWLRMLYECRHCWSPVYLKDAFWAGMLTTQRNESFTSFFDGYVDSKTSLKQFLSKYEMALQSKYEKEAQADFETFHKRRPSVSKFYMEEQLSKVYTLNVFKKFQDEIEAILYCHVSLVSVEGNVSTFDVKECIFLDDGRRSINKNHGVLYDSEEKGVHCICGSFQFRGILCRHALSIFKLQQVHEIPSQYILDRWKKDYKLLHVLNRSSDVMAACSRIDRYDHLSMRCLELVEVGILSDKYQLAMKLIREMEKFLLSDSTYEETQPKIVSRVNKPTKIESMSMDNMGKIISIENGSEEQRVRGRPLQLKESQMQQGVNPIVFPPGNQYAMNPQQFIGNQSAFRPSVVYMFPGGLNPQTLANGIVMPWVHQQIYQGNHPSGTAAEQARTRRKVARRLKATKPVDNASDLPPTLSSGS